MARLFFLNSKPKQVKDILLVKLLSLDLTGIQSFHEEMQRHQHTQHEQLQSLLAIETFVLERNRKTGNITHQ